MFPFKEVMSLVLHCTTLLLHTPPIAATNRPGARTGESRRLKRRKKENRAAACHQEATSRRQENSPGGRDNTDRVAVGDELHLDHGGAPFLGT